MAAFMAVEIGLVTRCALTLQGSYKDLEAAHALASYYETDSYTNLVIVTCWKRMTRV